MALPVEHVLQLKAKLVVSPLVATFTVVEEKVWQDRGYVRIRMTLANGDYVEAAEYFVLEDNECVVYRYRYQWMDSKRQELHKRWDNVEHHPGLPSFPHHVHVGREESVEPGKRLSIIQLLDVLDGEIPKGERE